jgi:hypothetical protein
MLQTDLLRSLTSRLEMHCESLIDEESDELVSSNRVYHEIPRRVFVALPTKKDILLSDYLFPGEGPRDSVTSFTEILSIHVNENDIDTAKEPPFGTSSSYHHHLPLDLNTLYKTLRPGGTGRRSE